MAAGMPNFVQGRLVPVDPLEIGLRWRHLHEIMPRVVEGPFSADPEIHPGCPDQRLGLRQNQIDFDGRQPLPSSRLADPRIAPY
jgi:hypothetical protein